MKKLISLGTTLTLLLGGVSLAYAQTNATTTPPTAHIQSDFGQDLQEGEQSTANDEEAQKNQQDVKDNENVGVNEEGEVRNGQHGADEQDLFESKNDLNQVGNNGDHGTSRGDEHASRGKSSRHSDSEGRDNGHRQGTTTQTNESSDGLQQGSDGNQ